MKNRLGHRLSHQTGFERDIGCHIGLNEDSIAMINFVLNDLCRPAGKGFDPSLKIFRLPFHLDRFVAFALSRIADE